MAEAPRYPDLEDKSVIEQLKALEDYSINLQRYVRYALNNIGINNMTKKAVNIIRTADGNVSEIKQDVDSISTRVTTAEGDISELDQRADGISARVEDVKGDFTEFKEDVDGWEFKIKNGSQTSSATIKNGVIDLRDFDLTAKNVSSVTNLRKTEIVDGNMTLYSRDNTGDDYYEAGHIHYDQLGRLSIGSSSGVVLKLGSSDNMSIDAAENKTVYIGNSSTKNNVVIGNSDSVNRRRIDLYGDVYINNNPVNL